MLRTIIAFVVGLLSVFSVSAQGFPVKPIRIVVPFAAGGSTDITARAIQGGLSRALGQPVVVENRAGAGGAIGAREVAKSPADGYTLLFGTPGQHIIGPALNKAIGYDGIADFTPISLLATTPVLIVARANLPVENLQGLIALAKKADKPLTFSSAGIGSNSHFVCEQFASHAGFKATHVPYRGAGPAFNAVLAGEVDFAMVPPSAPIFGFQSAGKVKVLAVTTAEASPLAPGIASATVAAPGFTHEAWFALLAPAGLPLPVLEKLNSAVRQVLSQPEVRDQILGAGVLARASSSSEMLDIMKKQLPEIEAIIRERGIRAE